MELEGDGWKQKDKKKEKWPSRLEQVSNEQKGAKWKEMTYCGQRRECTKSDNSRQLAWCWRSSSVSLHNEEQVVHCWTPNLNPGNHRANCTARMDKELTGWPVGLVTSVLTRLLSQVKGRNTQRRWAQPRPCPASHPCPIYPALPCPLCPAQPLPICPTPPLSLGPPPHTTASQSLTLNSLRPNGCPPSLMSCCIQTSQWHYSILWECWMLSEFKRGSFVQYPSFVFCAKKFLFRESRWRNCELWIFFCLSFWKMMKGLSVCTVFWMASFQQFWKIVELKQRELIWLLLSNTDFYTIMSENPICFAENS